jgi:uncharacterized protein YbjQ (UPF0145 family)
MEAFLNLGTTFLLLGAGFFFGRHRERKHLEDLALREAELASVAAVPLSEIAGSGAPSEIALVQGAVVVSIDYFKRVIAGIIGIFGGRIELYQAVIERARREALLRMKEDARSRGMDAVVCVRIETSRLASARSNGKGTSGIEVLAFGTGLRIPSVAPLD